MLLFLYATACVVSADSPDADFDVRSIVARYAIDPDAGAPPDLAVIRAAMEENRAYWRQISMRGTATRYLPPQAFDNVGGGSGPLEPRTVVRFTYCGRGDDFVRVDGTVLDEDGKPRAKDTGIIRDGIGYSLESLGDDPLQLKAIVRDRETALLQLRKLHFANAPFGSNTTTLETWLNVYENRGNKADVEQSFGLTNDGLVVFEGVKKGSGTEESTLSRFAIDPRRNYAVVGSISRWDGPFPGIEVWTPEYAGESSLELSRIVCSNFSQDTGFGEFREIQREVVEVEEFEDRPCDPSVFDLPMLAGAVAVEGRSGGANWWLLLTGALVALAGFGILYVSRRRSS